MSMHWSGVSAAEERFLGDLARRRDAMIADLARLVSIPTGKNHTHGLDECRSILTHRLEALGAKTELIPGEHKPDWLWESAHGDVIPPSALCARTSGAGPKILIACHIDTVFDPAGDFREMSVAPDGKTALGPGVVDMKGGILVAVNALEALEAAGVGASWSVLLTSDEETGSYHSDSALRSAAREHDIGFATEPALPGGELAIERMGSGQFLIETTGRAAHVGRDFASGVSATAALAEAVVAAASIADPGAGRIVSVGPLEGASAVNIVADRARAWGNARYPTREVADQIAARLDALATADGAMPGVRVERSFNRPAKPLVEGTERLALAARAAAEALGQELPFARTGGVCDGNILQDEGLPTIDTLGVRGGGLHTTDEWVELDSLVERAQLFALLVARLST